MGSPGLASRRFFNAFFTYSQIVGSRQCCRQHLTPQKFLQPAIGQQQSIHARSFASLCRHQRASNSATAPNRAARLSVPDNTQQPEEEQLTLSKEDQDALDFDIVSEDLNSTKQVRREKLVRFVEQNKKTVDEEERNFEELIGTIRSINKPVPVPEPQESPGTSSEPPKPTKEEQAAHNPQIKEDQTAHNRRVKKDIFLQAMRELPHPVVVLTAGYGPLTEAQMLPNGCLYHDSIKAMTVSSLTSVSIDPQLYISFNIKQPSHFWRALQTGNNHLRVNLLRADADGEKIANMFTKGSHAVRAGFKELASHGSKFQWDSWKTPKGMLMGLGFKGAGSFGWLDCNWLTGKSVHIGDHTVVFAQVARIHLDEDVKMKGKERTQSAGLVYGRGGFQVASSLHERLIDGKK